MTLCSSVQWKCFNTCSSCEEQLRFYSFSFRSRRFNTCSSCEEQRQVRPSKSTSSVSIHAPLARSNLIADLVLARFDVSIHAPLARSNEEAACLLFVPEVSIHAPLARSNFSDAGTWRDSDVSIHAPLARSNQALQRFLSACRVSIHAPLARSNLEALHRQFGAECFNTCSSCEEQLASINTGGITHVSIHAPLARSNLLHGAKNTPYSSFQYMLLLRGATRRRRDADARRSFNTCSSCEEQLQARQTSNQNCRFNTCSSCEEQLFIFSWVVFVREFQYMLLLRGATGIRRRFRQPRRRFNTCSSCEEQLLPPGHLSSVADVSIHAPLARSNRRYAISSMPSTVSIHAPLARSNIERNRRSCRCAVSIHAPLARSNCACQLSGNFVLFQYMLLLRGATRSAGRIGLRSMGFNTCSSCEEQPQHICGLLAVMPVSIHAPLARSNLRGRSRRYRVLWFQYMLLLRGATGAF